MASKKRSALWDVEESPLEAYAAEVISAETGIPGHIVHGCDGEDAYLWWVRPNKKGTGLRVTEVAPGLDKKSTRLRRVESASDLTYSTKNTFEQLLDRWTTKLIGDLVPEKAKNKSDADAVGDEAEKGGNDFLW